MLLYRSIVFTGVLKANICGRKHTGDKTGGSYYSSQRFVEEIAKDGMLSPVLEKEGILGKTTGRRPGDVTIQRWAEGKGLAIDVAVTIVLSATKCTL